MKWCATAGMFDSILRQTTKCPTAYVSGSSICILADYRDSTALLIRCTGVVLCTRGLRYTRRFFLCMLNFTYHDHAMLQTAVLIKFTYYAHKNKNCA